MHAGHCINLASTETYIFVTFSRKTLKSSIQHSALLPHNPEFGLLGNVQSVAFSYYFCVSSDQLLRFSFTPKHVDRWLGCAKLPPVVIECIKKSYAPHSRLARLIFLSHSLGPVTGNE